MKTKQAGGIFFVMLSCWFALSSFIGEDFNPPAGKKYALIVAIGNYPTSTDWRPISSVNDIEIMKFAFQKLGITDIAVIKDQQADLAGIKKAFKSLELKLNPGDMVTIHFSSHGQQIFDNNNDEFDGLDEAIVPFGAPATNEAYKFVSGKDYDGSLHLRDDDLGKMLTSLRVKVGEKGHVLVIMDACHSGTGTRGDEVVRGGASPILIKNLPIKKGGKGEDVGFGVMEQDENASRGLTSMGKLIVMSGAQASELNYETRDENKIGHGSLSYCFSRAVNELPKGTTYRTLFAKVQNEMALKATRQTPQLEGDADYQIFGGDFVPQEKYFEVSGIVDSTHIAIKAGKLMGLGEGAVVIIENSGTTKPTKDPLSRGVVKSITNFDASIELDKPLKTTNRKSIWVFPGGQLVPNVVVNVNLEQVTNAQLREALRTELASMGMCKVVSSGGDISIKEVPTRGAFSFDIMSNAYGDAINSEPLNSSSLQDAVKVCTENVQNFAQGKLFKELNLTSAEYDVRITRIFPKKGNTADTTGFSQFIDKGGNVVMKDGDEFYLELTNFGTKTAYFNVLDISPNGQISSMLPVIENGEIKTPVSEFKIPPGEKRISLLFTMYPPFGQEVLKVIATGREFNLGSIIVNPTVSTRGNENAVENLLKASFDKDFSTRGPKAQMPRDMGTNASMFVFKIVPKN